MQYYLLAVTSIGTSIVLAYALVFVPAYFGPSDIYADSNDEHVSAAVISIQHAIFSTPCLMPVFGKLPWICSGSLPADEERQACFGVVDILHDQHRYAQYFAYHTTPSDDFIATMTSVANVLDGVLHLGSESPGTTPSYITNLATIFDRCVQELHEITMHMLLGVSCMEAIELTALHALDVVAWLSRIFHFSPYVTLRRSMDISLKATLDSTGHLRPILLTLRFHLSEMRLQLQALHERTTALETCYLRDSSSSQGDCADSGLLDVIEGSSTFVQAIRLLEDVESSLQYLQEMVDDLVDGLLRRSYMTLSSVTCPVDVAASLLKIHVDKIHKNRLLIDELHLAAIALEGRARRY